MKEFKTYQAQLDLLKSRNLIIENEEWTLQKLKEENYYNIINGYKDLFLDSTKEDEFIKEATFKEIYFLYDFDRNLRNILLKSILKVENTLRSLIAYIFSQKYGHDNYLKIDNFETLKSTSPSKKTLDDRLLHIQSLLASIQHDISKSIQKKPYINHYITKHGFIPLWVLVNIMSLGRLSQFYSLMKQKERVEVSKHWNILESDLTQYIKVLAFYRNLCAHDERIYNSKCNIYIPDTSYHATLNIDLVNNSFINGKNDLFSLIIVLKILLPKEDFKNMCNKINSKMNILKNISSINYKEIFNLMGFPDNWLKLKQL